ncbi:MAG TPA: SAM-dependent chlorinase/fluorinase, partial [Anaerolineales bacterium]|nr:SAM-dependent chlorinase/fluorinase [Anaerolineales bacterium]
MSIVTLTTDFGLKDGNVGVMKGVIWKLAPRAHIADLSHQINPQNIAEAALILSRSAPYFPSDTVHIVVVDPGVGTARRPIAARIDEQLFVGPDNGFLTPLLERAEQENLFAEIIHINRPQFWLPAVSHVFHGRDIFAPVGGHLASGTPLLALGNKITDLVRLPLSHPQQFSGGYQGEIIHIDHFGNLSTNLRVADLAGHTSLSIQLRGAEIPGLYHTFGELPPGSLMALIGSTGSLIISVVNGSA